MLSMYFNNFHSNAVNNYAQKFGRLTFDATAKGLPIDQPGCVQIVYAFHGKTPGIFSFIQRQQNGSETTDKILYQRIGSQGYKYHTAFVAVEPIENGLNTTLIVEVASFPTTFGRETVSSGMFSLHLIDIKADRCPVDFMNLEKFCNFETGTCDYTPDTSLWKRGRNVALTAIVINVVFIL